MSDSPKLPVLQPINDDECGGGCGRRELLQGLAVASVLVGCRIDDPGADQQVDAAPPSDGVAGTGFEMCGANVCVDLTHPMNVNLTMVGKFRVIQVGTKKIMVARSAADTFITLSAVCTHAGCTVSYAAASSNMKCPCHGSIYMLDGSNVSGPALTPLKKFTNTFDMPGNLVTIMLT